jgi:rubrerythrin
METLQQEFNRLVRTSERVYTRKYLRVILRAKKKAAKIANKGLKPEILPTDGSADIYQCLTCGTVNRSHPVTSYCFVCDTDNFQFYKLPKFFTK